MAFSDSRKMSTAMASFGKQIKLGSCYLLTDGRVGVVKFIGKTTFRPGIEWFGLELTEGKGKNNGTVQGVSYFSCPRGTGVFVQLKSFEKKVAGKAGRSGPKVGRKAGALETGRSKYKAAAYELKDDGGAFLGEKNVKASVGGKVAKKDGSIATGRNKDYDRAKFEIKNDGGDFLGEKNVKASEGGTVAKKDGAIATGRNKDYNAADFKVEDNTGDFLSEKNVKAGPGGGVAKKKGAIETGRNENYDAAKFDVKNDGKDFLESKEDTANVKYGEKAVKKEGPRDV